MIVDKIKKRENSAKNKKSNIDIPVGKWVKCDECKEIIYKDTLKENLNICPNCGHYFRMHINRRIELITDKDSYKRFELNIDTTNPLELEDYPKKLKTLREKTGLNEAVACGTAEINGEKVVLCIMDSGFLMGSMGVVVGEKITYAIEQAIEQKLPLVIFTVSGGARMQEGIISLMQMAKVTSALTKLDKAGLLYITVLTDPTYGGVTASFASLGDIILAEPKAMIGFAGQRVIEQTIGQSLPEGFQTAEFLLEHGFIDKIVERKDLKETICKLIKLNKNCKEEANKLHIEKQTTSKNDNKLVLSKSKLTAWEKVEIARNPKRKTALDYIDRIFDEFVELHGDRNFKDDKAIVCGLGKIGNQNFTIIAEQKGRNTKENIERNFGMPNPESYRKGIRFMKQAEKFKRPIITFIDTKGAYPGIGAEERGQGEAIAKSMFEMAKLKVPVIAIVIGEGSSGGALALGVGNKAIMLENAIYSILSPEGYSSILWKDASRYKEAAEKMKLTAEDLLELKVIDKIIKENYTENNNSNMSEEESNFETIAQNLKEEICNSLVEFNKMSEEEIAEQRYQKFRKMGEVKYVIGE